MAITRLLAFLKLPLRQQGLLLQVWCLLGVYRLRLAVLPFKSLVEDLQRETACPPSVGLTGQQQEESRVIGRLVAAAALMTPWHSPCLLQVLVCRHLLQSRGIPGYFSLGFSIGSECGAGSSAAAHAWLQCGDTVISGASGRQQYRRLVSYSW